MWFVVLGEQVGVVDTPFSEMEGQGRLQGGNLLFVDLQEGRLITDDEVRNLIQLISIIIQ
jgi:glutamate synthase (NADPH/NADH) large chain